jgi:hypothetical protein
MEKHFVDQYAADRPGLETPVSARRPAISGTITIAGGRPQPGAVVTVAEPSGGRQIATGRTDSTGAFRIGVPAGGTYLLIVSAPDRRPSADLVAVTAAETRHDVALSAAGVVQGVARLAESNEPVLGGTVTLTDVRGQICATSTTGSDGVYRLDGVDAGAYTLVGSCHGLRPIAQAVAVSGSAPVQADLLFAAPGYRLRAIVAGPAGGPFAGAVVTLVTETGRRVASSISDGAGAVTFEDIPVGRYSMVATAFGPGVGQARVEPGQPAVADLALGVAES